MSVVRKMNFWNANGIYNASQVDAVRAVYETMVNACEVLCVINDIPDEETAEEVLIEAAAAMFQAKRLAMFELYSTPMPVKFDMIIHEVIEYTKSHSNGTYQIEEALKIIYDNLLNDETFKYSQFVNSLDAIINLQLAEMIFEDVEG